MANIIFIVEEKIESKDGYKRNYSLGAYETEEDAFNAIRRYVKGENEDVKWRFDFSRNNEDWLPADGIRIIGDGTFLMDPGKKKCVKGTMTLTVMPVWVRKARKEEE